MAPVTTDLRTPLHNGTLVPTRITAIVYRGLQLLLPPRPEGAKADAIENRALVADTNAPLSDQAAALELYHLAHDPASYQVLQHTERLVGLRLVSQVCNGTPASAYVHLDQLKRAVILAALTLGEDGKLHLANPRKHPLQ